MRNFVLLFLLSAVQAFVAQVPTMTTFQWPQNRPSPVQSGDPFPSTPISYFDDAGERVKTTTSELFAGKKVVLFGVPGAFTPTCSDAHLPGFIDNAASFKSKGVDLVACVAVHDAFVMRAWGKSKEAAGKVLMLADGNGELAAAMGILADKSGSGMGCRNKRFAAVIEGGAVAHIGVDEKGMEASSAEAVLEALNSSRL